MKGKGCILRRYAYETDFGTLYAYLLFLRTNNSVEIIDVVFGCDHFQRHQWAHSKFYRVLTHYVKQSSLLYGVKRLSTPHNLIFFNSNSIPNPSPNMRPNISEAPSLRELLKYQNRHPKTEF